MHRKIRCDGGTPICGQCKSIPGALEDCEYRDETGGKTNIELLEDNIARLERRIHELETIDDPPPPDAVFLSKPYGPSCGSQKNVLVEPTPDDRVNCLRTFVDNCENLSFFLLSGRFRDEAIRASQGHRTLCPAILNAACLWGARMAPHPMPQLEEYFLDKTHKCLSNRLQSSQNQPSVLYSIQVELLLALYYIDTGKSLRAGYHASAAVSLGNSAKLCSQGSIEAPSDPVEQFERIQAFWMGLIVSNHFVSQGPTPFNYPSETLVGVTTPWPIVFNKDVIVPSKNECVVQMYLRGQHDSTTTMSRAILAKSSILYEWSTNLGPQHCRSKLSI
ncbi:hypothetical protein DL96DRAFT_830643 [Flagelloscypha sp. PMI_526]|nr:hypothetical protein DL96DRAFT_830643 [Flagelloscypha sp. PMI_526]